MSRKKKDETRDALDLFYETLYRRERNTGRAGRGNRPWTQAISSDAMAVHPQDIKAAMEFDRKHGCSVEYDKHGRPKLTDRNLRARYMRAHGKFDRDGGYGDAQRGQSRLAGYEEPAPNYSHLDSASGPPGVEVASSVRHFIGVK